MWQFNQSLSYDQRMYAEDIRGSIAYANALALKGIYSQEECSRVVDGLKRVRREWEEGVVRAFSINASVRGALNTIHV